MDKKRVKTKDPLIHESSSSPASKPRRSTSPHGSCYERKSHQSRSPHTSHKRKSYRSQSPVNASDHVKQSNRLKSNHESTSKRLRAQSNSPERKTKKFSKPQSSEEKQYEHMVWSCSGKWQVQTVKNAGTGKEQSEKKAGSHSSSVTADQQPNKNWKKSIRWKSADQLKSFKSGELSNPHSSHQSHPTTIGLQNGLNGDRHVELKIRKQDAAFCLISPSGKWIIQKTQRKIENGRESHSYVNLPAGSTSTDSRLAREKLRFGSTHVELASGSQSTKHKNANKLEKARDSVASQSSHQQDAVALTLPNDCDVDWHPGMNKKLEEITDCFTSPSGRWLVQDYKNKDLFLDEKGENCKNPELQLQASFTNKQLSKEYLRVFSLEDKTKELVVLEHPGSLAFKGITRIRCICGQVNIYGYDITSGSQIYDVYSPASQSFICIKTTDGYHGELLESPEFSALTESSEALKAEVQCMKLYHNPVVILFEKLQEPALDFIDSMKLFYSLFPSNGKLKGKEDVFEMENVGIQVYGQHSMVTQLLSTDHFSEIKTWINSRVSEGSSPVILVCGGKCVGKSTLTRYIVNTILNRVKEVAYLECDVGQAEFTPGSCISVNRVTQPLLGPPFSHQEKPLCCCFLGVLSPSHNPEAYINCVTYVYNKFLACSMKCPLVVNTMGWNKSIGLALLTDILRLVKPDLVVQIDSRFNYKNLPTITSDFVAENIGWTSECIPPEGDIKQHSLIRVKSVVDKLEGRIDHYKPVDHRSMSLLSYFDHLLTNRKDGLKAIIPYEIPWHQVAVHVTHASVQASQIMYALNASVVALCQVDEDMMINTNIEGYPKFLKVTPVCPCLGFGIIRGIDPIKKVFYLLTPLSPNETSQINCLLLGALEVPQTVLLKEISGVPYVGYPKDVIGAQCVSKRKHMKRNKPFRVRPEDEL